ncbi:hypothetical protein LCGC14_0423340 [marine sediment metagenome]|uniref:Uncharacterized protein n=1 Tax=marine sediment metagenome TaxID=412755 RepID=A0A0F9VC75_9ZZZZ
MATLDEARVQLSKDLGDNREGTTTSIGAGDGSTIIDLIFGEEDVDRFFLNERKTSIFLPGTDEERVADHVTGLTGTPVDTLTMLRVFGAQVASGAGYEVHRLFGALEKEDAINEAIDLVWPSLFIPSRATVTTVAQQMDYDVSAAGFFRNVIRDLKIVSTADTEQEVRLFNWDNRVSDGDGVVKLHLGEQPFDARTLAIYGHKKMALADFTAGEDLLVLTARAAVYMLENELAVGFVTDTALLERLLQLNQGRFAQRLFHYKRSEIPWTMTSQMLGRGSMFNQFDV